VIESFKISRDGRLLTISVFVDGRSCQFAIDTGSSHSVFDPALRPAFDWTNREGRLNGQQTYSIWKANRASIGARKVPLVTRALCIDLEPLRTASRQDIWGILGMDFLRPHVLQIDFDAGYGAFLRSAAGAPGNEIQIEYDRTGSPTVAVSRSSLRPKSLLVDTGFVGVAMGSLSTKTFDQFVRSQLFEGALGRGSHLTIDGPFEGRIGTIEEHRLAGFRHAHPIYEEGLADSVGLGFLSRFKVTFDFLNGKLYLQPGKRYAALLPANPLDTDFKIDNGFPIFHDVEEGGVAWRHGIRNGDRLLAIDEKQSQEIPFVEIGHWLFATNEIRLRIASAASGVARLVLINEQTAAHPSKKL
jgi:hypothetical protein